MLSESLVIGPKAAVAASHPTRKLSRDKLPSQTGRGAMWPAGNAFHARHEPPPLHRLVSRARDFRMVTDLRTRRDPRGDFRARPIANFFQNGKSNSGGVGRPMECFLDRCLDGGLSPPESYQPGEHEFNNIDCTLLSSGPIS